MISVWLPVFAYLALIFGLSSLASLATPGGSSHVDKVAHLGEYGILGGLLMRAWSRTLPGRVPLWVMLTILIGVATGALDELWQGQNGRDSSVADWIADGAGVTIAALVLAWDRRRPGSLAGRWLSQTPAEGRGST